MYSTAATACKYIIKRTGDFEVYVGNAADTADKKTFGSKERQTVSHTMKGREAL